MRKVLFGAVAVTTLFACRGILGIQDLELGGASDATTDAGDASLDGSPVDPRIQQCVNGAECPKCCHQSFNQLVALQSTSKPCLCQRCQARCSDAGDFCTGPSGGQPSPSCGPCLDDSYRNGACLEPCQSPSCKAEVDCIKACPPPP